MLHPIQTEMLAKTVIEDRQREAARLRSIRAVRSIQRRAVPTWRTRAGGLLVRTGLALQGASRTRRAMAAVKSSADSSRQIPVDCQPRRAAIGISAGNR